MQSLSSLLRNIAAVALIVATTACTGPGAGDPDAPPDSGSSGGKARAVRIVFSDPTLSPDGSTAETGVEVQATVTDASNTALKEVDVAFTADSGVLIIGNTKTDATGVARAVLTTGGDATLRTITVTATVSGTKIKSQQPIPVSAGAGGPAGTAAFITLVSSKDSLSTTDSTAERAALLTAQVTDSSGNVLADAKVAFSVLSGPGAITVVKGSTDAEGLAIARLTTGGDTMPRVIKVRAAVGSIEATRDIPVVLDASPGASVSSLYLSKSRDSLASTDEAFTSAVTLTARATGSAGQVLADVPVTFAITAGGGAIQTVSPRTSSSGEATALLTTGGDTTLRTITVTATAGAKTATVNVPVISPSSANDNVARIALTTNRTSLFSDEDTISEGLMVNAQLIDSSGVGVSGAQAAFSILSGGGALSVANSGKADVNGVATALLTTGGDSTQRTITIQVKSGSQTQTLSVPVVSRGGGGATVTRIVLTSPTSTLYDDQDTAEDALTLTAQLLDASSNAVSGAGATFSISSGSAALISSNAISDTNGRVTAKVTTGGDPAPRSFTVTVTSGGVSQGKAFTIVPRVDKLRIIAAAPTLPSAAAAAADGLVLTAIVTDASNKRVAGIPVEFEASSGSLFQNDSETDTSGQATATLTTDGDPSPRTITITARAGNKLTSIAIPVSGTRLQITAPDNIGSSDVQPILVKLVDSAGAGITGQSVSLTSSAGNPIAPGSAVTASDGSAVFSYTGTLGGIDTLSASGMGLVAQKGINVSVYRLTFVTPAPGAEINLGTAGNIRVRLTKNSQPAVGEPVSLSASRGTLAAMSLTTDAAGEIATTIQSSGQGGAGASLLTAVGPTGVALDQVIEFVATTPSAMTVQPGTFNLAAGNQTSVTALVLDVDGNPVKNKTVTFSLNDPSGGALSTSVATTNSQGKAAVTYVAGDKPSGTNAVKITATQGSIVRTASLTVGGEAVRLIFGTGNSMDENDAGTLYLVPFTVIVTDAAGAPVTSGAVSLRVQSISYQKGSYVLSDTDGDGEDDRWVLAPTATPQFPDTFGCLNEDSNLNNFLDPNEDFNTNGQLDPGNVASVPSTVNLDGQGQANFNVSYVQEYANWVKVLLTVSTNVAGTETSLSKSFILPVLDADVTSVTVAPPGYFSPFGRAASCNSPN